MGGGMVPAHLAANGGMPPQMAPPGGRFPSMGTPGNAGMNSVFANFLRNRMFNQGGNLLPRFANPGGGQRIGAPSNPLAGVGRRPVRMF
jgi:hypothetical protein